MVGKKEILADRNFQQYALMDWAPKRLATLEVRLLYKHNV